MIILEIYHHTPSSRFSTSTPGPEGPKLLCPSTSTPGPKSSILLYQILKDWIKEGRINRVIGCLRVLEWGNEA